MAKKTERDIKIGELAQFATSLDTSINHDLVEQFAHYYGAVGEGIGALNTLRQLLFLGLTDQAEFSHADVKLADRGIVYSARDMEEARTAYAPSSTNFTIWSWRTYIRNFDTSGRIRNRTNKSLSQDLRENRLQTRIQHVWLGDEIGLPETRAAELNSLMEANVQMEAQVRRGLSGIDTRDIALQRLSHTIGYISELPSEMIIVDFERVFNPQAALKGLPGSMRTELEVELIWTLGGSRSLQIRNGAGHEIINWNMDDIEGMPSLYYLRKLTKNVEKAVDLFGPANY